MLRCARRVRARIDPVAVVARTPSSRSLPPGQRCVPISPPAVRALLPPSRTAMHNPPLSPPDGYDFDPEFLDDPAHLPQFVESLPSPLFGTARRVTAADLPPRFRLATRRPTTGPGAHHLVLDGVYNIVEDRERKRNRLFGPAELVIDSDLLDRHWLWIGPPGVGKTSQGVLPMVASLLADRHRSLVVFDAKGDQFGLMRDLAVTAGRSRQSVLRLNLTDPGGSIGWNPLRRGMTRTELMLVASTLVLASESQHSHDSPFWRNTSIDILVDILQGLDRDPEETLTLPRVLEILALPRKQLLLWLHAHGAGKFATFLESGSHNAETCLVDTNMRLVSLLDLDLCAVLSHDELQLERLFRRPTVLVVEMNESRIARLRPIFNMLVQKVLDLAIETADKSPQARLRVPLSVVLDEFGSAIGAIPHFPTYLNTLRSRRVSIVAAVQGLTQIRALYGPEAGAVLVGFSSKIVFPNAELEDAEWFSAAAGTMTVRVENPDGTSSMMARRLYLPEEIMRPKLHPVLGRPVTMLLADTPALQAYLAPHFRLPRFRAALQASQRRRVRPRRRDPLRYPPPPKPPQPRRRRDDEQQGDLPF